METRPPTVTRILIAVGFALSCFGLALFLWIAFGGPLPLKPEGYRVTVPFKEATQLATESDVRISGVSVGKVKSITLSDQGYADATIELDSQYAPIPDDTRAILRQKTLLGETYVELTPGSRRAPSLPEGASLPPAQVSNAVQLDDVDIQARQILEVGPTSARRSASSTRSPSRRTAPCGSSTASGSPSGGSYTAPAPCSRRSRSARASSAG